MCHIPLTRIIAQVPTPPALRPLPARNPLQPPRSPSFLNFKLLFPRTRLRSSLWLVSAIHSGITVRPSLFHSVGLLVAQSPPPSCVLTYISRNRHLILFFRLHPTPRWQLGSRYERCAAPRCVGPAETWLNPRNVACLERAETPARMQVWSSQGMLQGEGGMLQLLWVAFFEARGPKQTDPCNVRKLAGSSLASGTVTRDAMPCVVCWLTLPYELGLLGYPIVMAGRLSISKPLEDIPISV